MLSDVLHTVVKLQTSLQSKEMDLASVPVMVKTITERLRELVEFPDSSTLCKDHTSGFNDPAQLGTKIKLHEFGCSTSHNSYC